MKRIVFSLPDNLLAAIDQEAKYNYMTRSDLIRQALIWYLRPDSRIKRHATAADNEEQEELYTNPEELFKIMQQQKLKAGIKAMLREAKKRRTEGNAAK